MRRKKIAGIALLIIGAIAVVFIVYALSQSTIGCIGCGAESVPIVSGTITVPAGSNEGTLVITVRNTINEQITTITASLAAQDSGVTATSGGLIYAAGGSAYTIYTGDLSKGQSASSTVQLTGASVGNIYIFTVTIYSSAFSPHAEVQTLSLTASA
jgi:hypothetical protein